MNVHWAGMAMRVSIGLIHCIYTFVYIYACAYLRVVVCVGRHGNESIFRGLDLTAVFQHKGLFAVRHTQNSTSYIDISIEVYYINPFQRERKQNTQGPYNYAHLKATGLWFCAPMYIIT
jgi:hypothetical protein